MGDDMAPQGRSGQPSATLREMGWSAELAAAFVPHAAEGCLPGRVVSSGGVLLAMTAAGAMEVVLQRRHQPMRESEETGPSVGDWLALEPVRDEPGRAILRQVLPRRGTIVRSRASDGRPQVLAANLDVALLVSGLDHDFNPRRIERYLLLAVQAAVTPIVILNKVDIAVDLGARGLRGPCRGARHPGHRQQRHHRRRPR